MSHDKITLNNLQLYHSPSCGYCYRVRTALLNMGIEIPLKSIYSDPTIRTELIRGGGKSQVPCLRIEDDNGEVRWLYESTDIIRYIKNRVDQST